jgi:hypothetical protein
MFTNLSITSLAAILNTLPLDMTFMDADNKIRWFSGHRIFSRPADIIGTDVRHCHKPSSWPAIDRMVADFKSGAREIEEHLADKGGRRIRIRYMAVRDSSEKYIGLLELAEEIPAQG